ncbi:hypothetical protein B566_EDAN015801 [Ephemera danica]|nr:hypothetical protein B566_EDAN015801 [Ephemera danica]
MEILRSLSNSFWTRHVWLPPNTTWADMEKNDIIQHTVPSDLIYPLPMALVLLVVRFIVEKYWFSPLGLVLGIKNSKPKRVPPNAVLESAYKKLKGPNKHKEILGLSKQVDLTERQIESWRCFYYTLAFFGGLYIVWDKPWLWDINKCWYSYPHQNLTNDVWWYYMFSMSFYWSLTMSQFFDVKRKDFWQMFVHHMATIMLMAFSWMCNLTRIGTLVLVVHDCGDILLEAAKSAKYANYQRTCDLFFIFFTALWLITRLGIYPFWIIYSTSIEAPTIVEMFPAYYIFNSLLLLLLVLHIFWTYLIMRIVYNSIVAGKMDGDVRSSTSDEIPSIPSEDEVLANNHHKLSTPLHNANHTKKE